MNAYDAFLPRSLKGQLILLILVGLLLSQAAGFVFILNDQKSRMKSEWLHNIFTRMATVRDVIELTPGEIHGKILKTSSTWALKFAIDSEPLSRTKEGRQTEAVQQELRRVFGDRSDEVDITILLSSIEEPYWEAMLEGLWRDIKQTFSTTNSHIPAPPARPTYANVSLPLKSGLWLNVSVTPRGGAPHASPLLVQFATMAAISALGIVFVLSRLTQPLKELAQAAAALGRGEFDHQARRKRAA